MRSVLAAALVCASGSAFAAPVAPADPACFCAAVPADGVRVAYIGNVHAGTEGTVLTVEEEVCGGECGAHPAGTDIDLGTGPFATGRSVAFQVDGEWKVTPVGTNDFVTRFASEDLAPGCYRAIPAEDAVELVLNHDCTTAATLYFAADEPQPDDDEDGCQAGGLAPLLGLLALARRRTR